MYDAVEGGKMKYPILKRKLLAWDEDQQGFDLARHEPEWDEATIEDGESLFIYASRLEQLAEKIFQTKSERNRQLLRKFSRTVPRKFKEVLSRHDRDLPAAGEKLTWRYAKKLAAWQDRHERYMTGGHSTDEEYDIPDVLYSRPSSLKDLPKPWIKARPHYSELFVNKNRTGT